MTDEVTSLIERLVKAITTNKDDVRVEALALATKTPIRIEVHPSEVGRVIGEHGTHFKALQNLVLAISYKRRIVFELLPMEEPGADVTPIRYGRFKGQDNWPKQQITELVTQVSRAAFKYEEAVEIDVRDMTNFCSAYTIHVAKREDGDVVNILQKAFTTLFNAVGRINGRVLIVEIVADKIAWKAEPKDERQPLTADGRHCKTIRR